MDILTLEKTSIKNKETLLKLLMVTLVDTYANEEVLG